MTLPLLQINGHEIVLSRVQFSQKLDYGAEARVWVAEHVANLKRGTAATLHVAGRAIELVVRHFRMPRERSTAGSMTLVDPVRAAKDFAQEAFSKASDDSSADHVVSSRIPLSDAKALQGVKSPAFVASAVSFLSVLQEVCARQANWHWRLQQGKLHVGPLPEAQAIVLEGGHDEDTDEGLETVILGQLPDVGDNVTRGKITGRVLRTEFHYELGGGTEARVVLGQPEPPPRLRLGATTLLLANVLKPTPLFVEVSFPDGTTASVRARLLSLKANKGQCQIAMPVEAGDTVVVAWPSGLWVGEVLAFPLGDVPAAAIFGIHAQRAETKIGTWNWDSTTIDAKIADVVNFHR